MDESVDTQAAILGSAVTLLQERTFEDISYPDLAEASAVSERTIYRRFPTRSHLLEALARWIEAERFPLAEFHTPEEFREAVRERFRAYGTAPGQAFVAARGAALSPTTETKSAPVTVAILAMIESAAPTLNNRDTMRIAAAARYFASPIFWARMRAGFDMNADETFAAFDRALGQVFAIAPEASWTR
ncbi:TetR/AcrR family transcriptional regulator [Microbacteriaceae bacterium VKM Ac-2855]|nr:TetR/AcrR family transcriptional regulator [Microbacteriaceae bacterium VKM Ac-2855]